MEPTALPETIKPINQTRAKVSEALDTYLSASIPPFVINQITSRLRFVAWAVIIGTMFFLRSFFSGTYQQSMKGNALSDYSVFITLIITAAISFLVIFLLRVPRPSKEIIIISVVYENLMAFTIALHDGFWFYPTPYNPEPRLFWSCIWILAFPIIVPYSPRISLFSSLSSIVLIMGAIALPILVVPEQIPPKIVFRMVLETHLFCAVVAYFISRMLNHLNWQLANEKKKGSYQLIRQLGEGSMGQVWLAKHRMLHRPAAMKIIQQDRLHGASEEIRQEVITRFEREAQATARLHNQHSINIYDFGTMEDDSFFYVMEALNGTDLQQFVNRFGPLPEERVIYLMLQIAESLQEAHAIGLVHRDLKPANIFICRYGFQTDFIKVLDFGMVKYQEDLQETFQRMTKTQVSTNIELTTEGQLAGTPAYMAPEMIMGKKIDHRYDVYAFGCVAYFLLTGTRVFQGESLESQLYSHMEEKPKTPSERSGATFHPLLETLIMSCLKKNPNDRPANMDILIAELKAVPFADPWTPEKANLWWNEFMPLQPSADTRPSADPVMPLNFDVLDSNLETEAMTLVEKRD